MHTVLKPPTKALTLAEGPRTAADFMRMLIAIRRAEKANQPNQNRRVMVVPGFGGSDWYTQWLRRYLATLGFQAEGWSLGRNMGGRHLTGTLDFYPVPPEKLNAPELEVPLLSMRLREHLRERVQAVEQPYTLVGHSLGGYLAREVTRQAPALVEQLITFGSPVYGGPKYTAAATAFNRLNVDMNWIESVILEREQIPIPVPITTIVSPTDGVVGYAAALDQHQPHAKRVEISTGHTGMAFSPKVWMAIRQALSEFPST